MRGLVSGLEPGNGKGNVRAAVTLPRRPLPRRGSHRRRCSRYRLGGRGRAWHTQVMDEYDENVTRGGLNSRALDRTIVAVSPSGDLFICANDLLVEAMAIRAAGWSRLRQFRFYRGDDLNTINPRRWQYRMIELCPLRSTIPSHPSLGTVPPSQHRIIVCAGPARGAG